LVISRNRVKFINSVLFLSFLLGQWIWRVSWSKACLVF
jgi:hypothetical protein